VAAKKAVTTTVQMLQSLRDDVKFDELYDDCVRTAASLDIDEPKLGRRVPPPWRLDKGSAGHHPLTCRDKFRKQYNEFLDVAVATISDHFDNLSYVLFEQIETILVDAASSGTFDQSAVQAICQHISDEVQQDTLTGQLASLKDIA